MTRHARLAAPILIGLAAACQTPPAAVQVKTATIDETKDPFFSAPWPDDRRLYPDGTIPTVNFPNPGGADDLWANDLMLGDHLVKGWGTQSPIYMPFTGAIDTSSLPADPRAASPSVFLIALDSTSPARGVKHFIDFHFYQDKTVFLPGNVLAIRPVPGFPLLPKTKYGLVITTAVLDVAGNPVGPNASLNDILQGKASSAQEKSDATFYSPLLNELKREGFPLSKVAGVTVFTTQAITDEMLVLRDYLLSQPVPQIQNLKLITSFPASPSDNFWLFEGTYQAPHMQHGTLPYVLSGGDFEYDSSGKPIPNFSEQMRVAITVPKGTPPAGGYPAVMYSHGTGGDFESIVLEEGAMGPLLASKGIVGFGIDQILTGPRACEASARDNTNGCSPGSCLSQPIEDCFFDFVNPIAGRNNLRQAALDNIFLRQVVTHTTIPASVVPINMDITIQSDRIGFLGHSQGGITGALYSPVDPFLWGSVLSGAGGLITSTVLERQVPDAKVLAESPLFLAITGQDLLDWYHPALALAQALAEVVDPVNYAPYWFKNPNGRAKNIYSVGGLYDQDTVADSNEYMQTAAGVPQLLPIGREAPTMELAGLTPVGGPVTNNIMPGGGGGPITAGFRQFPGEGHFPIFTDPIARDQLTGFLQSLLTTGTATIPAQ
jgi:hypothetical protein